VTTPKVRGEVKILPLASVKANTWNPNVMTPEMKASLKHGLVEDGWIASQALLIWGTDEQGAEQNIIIDGEHRYVAAVELGLKKGPMVKLDLLTEAEAKALTVKLNQKRGDWNPDKLGELLKELAQTSETPLTGIDLGFSDEGLMKLLAVEPMELQTPTPDGEAPKTGPHAPQGANGQAPPPTSSARMVQLYLDDTTHPPFMEKCAALCEKWGTKNVTDCVLKAIEEAHARELP
jgi:hypothetical protein